MSENEKTTYVAYLRQSTKKQEISGLGIEAQREIIGRYLGQEKPIAEFVETESGKKTDRPKLTEALALCRKTGSTLIVAKLDRLSRNVAFTSKLLESDVEIKFCDFPEANRLVLHIIASIAEYEASLISQRTKQSLEAKRQRGITLGKPENLVNNLDQAISNSNNTNKQKALNNPNNKRAVAYLRVLVSEGRGLSEMSRILNRGLNPHKPISTEMIKTIKELLIEWWAGNTTTKMPIPTIYTYEVEVDGKCVHIESMSRSRMYIHYKARKKYPNAMYIRVINQTKTY